MKKIYTILTILSFMTSYAQYNSGTLFLKDGTFQKGLIKEATFGGVKFKTNINSKSITYNYNDIKGYENKTGKYYYRYVDKQNTPILLKLAREGKFLLYETIATVGGGFNSAPQIQVTHFYISTNLKDKVVFLGNRLKKKHLSFFNDCPELMEKIKKKEIKRRGLDEIVQFYNGNCN